MWWISLFFMNAPFIKSVFWIFALTAECVLFEALNFAIRITVTIQIYWFRVIDFLFWATCLNQFKFDTAAASGKGLFHSLNKFLPW
jgi:hypothetical protein